MQIELSLIAELVLSCTKPLIINGPSDRSSRYVFEQNFFIISPQALEIREKILGPQSVDTATMYNNVGCCMFFLERVEESYNYFDIAHAIFELELGPFHYRTLTVKTLIQKWFF